MGNRFIRLFIIFISVVTLALMVENVFAQDVDLPKAEEILQKYIKATSGENAYEEIQNRVTKLELEIVGTGIVINMTLYQAKPNKAYILTESAVTGKIESGTNGDVAWRISEKEGAQILEGEERATMLRDNTLDKYAHWQQVFKTVTCVDIVNTADRTCYKVEMTTETGNMQTVYFDKESYLIVRLDEKMESAMGTIPFESYLGDYRQVDKILLPFENKVLILGQVRVIRAASIENNVDISESMFDLPEEIKALHKQEN